MFIQKLSEYKDQYAFVVTREDDNKDRATQWANNAANYQNIIDNNKEMSQAERKIYGDIIKDIRSRGVEAMVGK